MNGINVETSVTLDHAKIGAEVWEWNSEQQADFLAGMAKAFRHDPGVGIMQISHIAAELHTYAGELDHVRWLNDILTEYLKEDNA